MMRDRSARIVGCGVAFWLALPLSACGPDAGQVQICERVLHALAPPGARPAILERAKYRGAGAGVTLVYTARAASGAAGKSRMTCLFAGAGVGGERLRLVGVLDGSGKPLSALSVIVLRRRLGLE